jgi:Holliday junction resolvase
VHADDFTTFDVKLDQLLTHKRSLAEDMLNGSGDVRPGDFDVVNILPATDAGDIDERITLDMALRMNGQHFECLIAALWNKQGYETHLTRNSKDNGIDIVALDGAKGHLIQAKASSTDGSKLSWDAVKEVVAGAAFYERLYAGVKFDRICVTNQFFSPQAHDNAQLNGVVLLEQKHLGKSLQEIAVTVIDVERMLYRDRLTVGIPTD